MSNRKLFSIFSNSYTITFSSFDHTIPVPSGIINEKFTASKVSADAFCTEMGIGWGAFIIIEHQFFLFYHF
jgi:hypothetical protein